MRTILVVGVVPILVLGALAACQKAPSAGNAGGGLNTTSASAKLPTRRAGLWEQTLMHDGQPSLMGKMRVCADAATDARQSIFGAKTGDAPCRQSVSRTSGGGYGFASRCDMGQGGVIASTGVASGDFATHYRVHVDSEIAGASFAAMNGRHVTDIEVRYLGPCPPDMAPGDIALGNGMKLNAKKIRQAAQALGGGG